MKTTSMKARDLTDQIIVGDAGGTSRVTGEVYESSMSAGSHVIETEHGALYLDSDEELSVIEGESLRPSRDDLTRVASALVSSAGGDPSSEYLRGMVDLIALSTLTHSEDLIDVSSQVRSAILGTTPSS